MNTIRSLAVRGAGSQRGPVTPTCADEAFAGFMPNPLALTTVVLLTAAIVPFLILAFFNQASADDYCFASAVSGQSFWSAQVDWYQHWTGRFTSTLLISAVAASGIPSHAFVAVPLANVAVLFGALAFLGFSLFGRFANRAEILVAAATITTISLASMPNVAEGLYWASGSLTYTLPSALLLVALAAAMNAGRATTIISRRMHTILTSACVFIAGGASETLAAVASIGVGLAAWSAFRHGRSPLRLLPYAVAAIGAGLIVSAAPGVGQRMEGFSPPSLGDGLGMLLKVLYYHVLNWTIFGLLLAAAGWHLLLRWAACRALHDVRASPSHPVAAACALILVVLAVIAPAALVRGAVPDRVLNVAYLAVILGVPYLWFSMLAWLAAERPRMVAKTVETIRTDIRLRRTLNAASLTVLALMLANSPGLQSAYGDLTKGRATAYAKAWQVRHQQLAACGVDACRLGPIAAAPASLEVADLSTDPGDWKNRCAAELYGVRAISVAKP